jgi:hypothetical protein
MVSGLLCYGSLPTFSAHYVSLSAAAAARIPVVAGPETFVAMMKHFGKSQGVVNSV